MKKILISLVAVLTMGGTCLAQSSLMATLMHGENVTYFYGDTALIAAHRAAVHGDEILLSSGYFKAEMSIEKAITIRGAGMEQDSISGIGPTVLQGATYVRVPVVEGKHLEMEGIYHDGTMYAGFDCTIYGAVFNRCKFNNVSYQRYGNSYSYGRWNNATFVSCRVGVDMYDDNSSATFVNCIVPGPAGGCIYTFKNCLVFFGYYRNNNCYPTNLYKSWFSNCFIYYSGSDYKTFNNTNTMENCVFNNADIYANSMSTSNQTANFANVFETFDTNTPYHQSNSYKLKADAAAKYLCPDGTQIGIWGGNTPFAALPGGPRVKYISVGSQQADGKLKVTVEMQ